MGKKQVRKKFSDQQLEALRKNPYVYNVTQSRLMLTKEFKEIFMNEYSQGISSREILEKYGFTEDLIGIRRIDSIPQHIFDEYEIYGSFHNGYVNSTRTNESKDTVDSNAGDAAIDTSAAIDTDESATNPPDTDSADAQPISESPDGNQSAKWEKPVRLFSRDDYISTSEKRELLELRHEVKLLRQEVEFLKKIVSIKTTKR